MLLLEEEKNKNAIIEVNRKISEKEELLESLKLKAKEKRKKQKIIKKNMENTPSKPPTEHTTNIENT